MFVLLIKTPFIGQMMALFARILPPCPNSMQEISSEMRRRTAKGGIR